MSVGLVTGLLFAAISTNMIPVECSIKTAEAGREYNVSTRENYRKYIGQFQYLYKRTKWCGIGKKTKNDDFGTSEQTDRCCKEHHGCDTFITAGDFKYNLTNTANYTVSGCDCDRKFLDCLVGVTTSANAPAADKSTAGNFGVFFFNLIGPKCLKHDYPLVCVRKGSRENCTKYNKDPNQAKVWQLVNGPTFPSL